MGFDMRIPVHTIGITLTEIPNAFSIFVEVGNCKQSCKGCHSPHLWSDKGATYMSAIDILEYAKTQPLVDTIVFMGGFTNGCDRETLSIIQELSRYYPIGLYHGNHMPPKEALEYITYLKLGDYREELGGLDKPTTNQIFLKKSSCGIFVDNTHLFKRKGHDEN